jgi:hypothetical protein
MERSQQIEICGTDLYHHINIETIGERYKKNRSEDERYVLDFVSSNLISEDSQGVMTIPVVFHVVYNKEIENISDEQIYRQLEILNRDFRRLNSDITGVPAIWNQVAADTRIEFKLARKDPLGRSTSGITRTRTTIEKFLLEIEERNRIQKIKFTSEGGKDAWDTTRYLNIWICDIGISIRGVHDPNRILNGYAQFPRAPLATDGVVLFHWVVGDIGTAISSESPVRNSRGKGRTAVHEIGHYLDCYHTWGDEGMFEDPCSRTDNVMDTPNQRGPNRGKPEFPSHNESCDDTGDSGTMFMNYMDYTDDDKRIMFTLGQMARMHATLVGPRASLLQSDVLRSPEEESLMTDTMRLPEMVYDGVNKIVNVVEKL